MLRTVPSKRPFHSLRRPAPTLGAVVLSPASLPHPYCSPPSLPIPLVPLTTLCAAATFSNEQVLAARASLRLAYVTCRCFWSKDHPGKALRSRYTARASLLTIPTPLELRGGTGIWTLQELTAPPPAAEPNLRCSSFFVNFLQTGLSQREPVGCSGSLGSCSPDISSGLLAGT